MHHHAFVRNLNAQYVEEYWKYDYFTTYALGMEPASGLKFYSARSTLLPGVECVHAYVDVGGEVSDKGLHCWLEGGGGGSDLPPSDGFPDQPIPDRTDNDGGIPGGGTGLGPSNDPIVKKVVYNASALTDSQIQKLKEAITVMEDICMVDALMGEMNSQGNTIGFVNIDPALDAIGAEASYRPEKNMLSFPSTDKITPQALLHEYFHFYQTKKNNSQVQGKNGVMEIERNIYYDIVFTCMYFESGGDYNVWEYQPDVKLNNCMTRSKDIYDEYDNWLKQIYGVLKSGGTILITGKDLEKWGNLYKEYATNSEYNKYDYAVGNYKIVINDALKLGVNGSNNCLK